MNERDLGRALIDAFGQVAGPLTGGDLAQAPGAAPEGAQWAVTLAAEGALQAACVLTIDHAGASALASNLVAQTDDASIEGVLWDVLAQVVEAVLARDLADDVRLTVRSVARADAAPSGTALAGAVMSSPGLAAPMCVGYYAVLAPSVTGERTRASQRSGRADAQSRLDVILDIDLPVVVRFGRTEMPLRSVTRLAPGSVIDLGRSPDDPVELLVSDRVVARGEVVVVSGNYGIRIVDVVSPSERMRSLEA